MSARPCPADTTEVDPLSLEERRERARARLAALRPGWSPDRWREAAREQLIFWIRRKVPSVDLPARFADVARVPHGLGVRDVFAAFFCFEPEGGSAYFEIPFLLAVVESERTAIADTAAALGLEPEVLSDRLYRGPFVPEAARPERSR